MVGESFESRLACLESGVLLAKVSGTEVSELVGPDHGLYSKLIRVANSLDRTVCDDDNLTGEILIDGRRGLHKRFFSGWQILVKRGTPLGMAALLAHEIGHIYAGEIDSLETLARAETIAEGISFIICAENGLDTAISAFPWIAEYNNGIFTEEMRHGILVAGAAILTLLQDVEHSIM